MPYAADEEEGEMVWVSRVEDVLSTCDWIVGEPIEEKTLTFATTANSIEPDRIFTIYRLRVTRRAGKSKHSRALNSLEEEALRQLPLNNNEVLVIKSGGNVIVDGVLLKKQGSRCFSELLPHPYLLALQMDRSARVGWLELGCRSIYSVSGDRLTPRYEKSDPLVDGIRIQFGNSLQALLSAVESLQTK